MSMEDFEGEEYYGVSGNMKDLDFKRFNYLLHNAGIFAINARQSFEFDSVRGWWSVLKTIYNNWRPFLNEATQKELDASFKEIYAKIMEIAGQKKRSNVPRKVAKETKELFDLVEAVDLKLFEQKKKLRLGMLGRRTGEG